MVQEGQPPAPQPPAPPPAPRPARPVPWGWLAFGAAGIVFLAFIVVVGFAANWARTQWAAVPPYSPPGITVPPPVAPPSQAPAQPPAASAQQPPSGAPYGQPPQPYIGHPSWYQETGIGQTRRWTLPVDPDKVLIVGGFKVDSQSGGLYKAWPGNQTVTVEITDGFAAVIRADWGPAEFCFRVNQAGQFGWARQFVEPLPGWPPC